MVKSGEITRIREFQRIDVDKMRNWGNHEDPRFFHYSFPNLTEEERDLWYEIKNKKFNRKCFAVDDLSGNMIGYISLRNIKFFTRLCELGIVFDPNILGMGYGTDALNTLLDIYFNNLKMKKLLLKVAKFNQRAIRCYEKCGFKINNEMLEDFEEQDIDKESLEFILNSNENFIIEGYKLKALYYSMEITKKGYNIHKESQKMLISL